MDGLLVDSHCHLDFAAFDHDRSAVVERARLQGVGRILNPGVDLASSRRAVQLADEYPEIYAAVGVHPNSANAWDESSYAQLKKLAAHPKVVAIGEIGLDFYRQRATPEQQRLVFRRQLELAGELGLPVVIHTRSPQGSDHPAMQQALELLQELLPAQIDGAIQRPKGVFHSYSADLALAQRALELGFLLGFSGPLTYPNASQAQQVTSTLPLDALLVETDAPFLTPHPHRGQRNEPSYVRFVADKIAQLRVKSITAVADACTRNATRLFQW